MKRALLFSTFVLAAACDHASSGPGPSAPAGKSMQSITVTSKSFVASSQIPVDYTCDGKNTSPQLTWSSPPEGTTSLAIVVEDPDASSGTFTHWTVWGIPAETTFVPEALDVATLGNQAKVGENDFHDVGYNGPCPPHGEAHRYQYSVYALDLVPKLTEGANREAVNGALSGHVLGVGTLTAIFGH